METTIYKDNQTRAPPYVRCDVSASGSGRWWSKAAVAAAGAAAAAVQRTAIACALGARSPGVVGKWPARAMPRLGAHKDWAK